MPRTVTIDGYDFDVAPLDEADFGDGGSVYVILVEDDARLLIVDVGQVPAGAGGVAGPHRRACWEQEADGRPLLVGIRPEVGDEVEGQIRRFHHPPCAPD